EEQRDRMVAHDSARAAHSMPQPQGQLLSREARRSRPRQVARQRLEVAAPLALRERVFELELAVEMVLDDGLVAAGDEDEMLDAGLARLVDHVLNQRPGGDRHPL